MARRAVHCAKKVEAAGYEVDYVSPRGRYTPIDPHTLAMAEPVDWEWYQKKEFMNRLGNILKPSEVNPSEYGAIYYAGGHGVIWDFPENKPLQTISRKIDEGSGYVSSVCHGPFAIADGRVITGQNPASGGAVADLLIAELKRTDQ